MPEPESKSIPEVATDLWGLTRDYARQETIDPLKGVGRYFGYGGIGALLGSIGVILLMLSLLRRIAAPGGAGGALGGAEPAPCPRRCRAPARPRQA